MGRQMVCACRPTAVMWIRVCVAFACTSVVTADGTVRSWVGHVDDAIIRRYTHIADRVSQQHMRELTQGRAKNSESSS